MSEAIHVVISLEHGGLERLVVQWTNARNQHVPGSTSICCLDQSSDLAEQVEGDVVWCVNADRSHFPWDRHAVRRIRAYLSQIGDPGRDRRARAENAKEEKMHESLAADAASGFTHDVSLESGEEAATKNAELLVRRRPRDGGRTKNTGRQQVVLHAHNLAAWQYAVLAAKGSGAKVVYTQHGANVHNQGFKNRMRMRWLAKRTDTIVAVSGATADAMAKQGISEEAIEVVPNGVDIRTFPPTNRSQLTINECRAKLGIPEDAFVIGSVGRLAHVKGYDRLLASWRQVVNSCSPFAKAAEDKSLMVNGGEPSARLLLVGDGDEREALERQAEELGIADNVIFAGYQEDPRPFYAMMDLFVLPSRSEGMPVALLEAMASGVPVAVTNVGSSAEVVGHGEFGTVLPDDEGKWREVFWTKRSEARGQGSGGGEQRSEAARERVAMHYSLDATMAAYEAIYAEDVVTLSGC